MCAAARSPLTRVAHHRRDRPHGAGAAARRAGLPAARSLPARWPRRTAWRSGATPASSPAARAPTCAVTSDLAARARAGGRGHRLQHRRGDARRTSRPAARARKPLLIGTTGHGEAPGIALAAAARDIALLIAPNTSLGVTLLVELTRRAARGAARGLRHRHARDCTTAPSATRPRAPRSLSGRPRPRRAGSRARTPSRPAGSLRARRARSALPACAPGTPSGSTRCCFAGAGRAAVADPPGARSGDLRPRGAGRCALAGVAAAGALRDE